MSLISSKKTNENKSTWGIIVVKSNFFVLFLEEIEDIKNPLEIIRPLCCSKIEIQIKTFWTKPKKDIVKPQNSLIAPPTVSAVTERPRFVSIEQSTPFVKDYVVVIAGYKSFARTWKINLKNETK